MNRPGSLGQAKTPESPEMNRIEGKTGREVDVSLFARSSDWAGWVQLMPWRGARAYRERMQERGVLPSMSARSV